MEPISLVGYNFQYMLILNKNPKALNPLLLLNFKKIPNVKFKLKVDET